MELMLQLHNKSIINPLRTPALWCDVMHVGAIDKSYNQFFITQCSGKTTIADDKDIKRLEK
jgi:hypothetical protein